MQLLEHWDPLSLPKGSVRALVTLVLVGVLWALMLLERSVPPVYVSLAFIVLGHYFGSRAPRSRRKRDENATAADTPPPANEKSPLGLPRGTIRTLLIVGFGAVGYVLWSRGNLTWDASNENVTILGLCGALQLGFLVRGLIRFLGPGHSSRGRRFIENTKAVIVLCAAILLAIIAAMGSDDSTHHAALMISAPIVGFYFGSRG